ncbi:unnamed protein product [Orchesella dallaii]|uniref:Uncharacterized protein n=1 Tax=Orchesella dallaii TaxID=48710 RepID=A0ABP1RGS9_9HEXA
MHLCSGGDSNKLAIYCLKAFCLTIPTVSCKTSEGYSSCCCGGKCACCKVDCRDSQDPQPSGICPYNRSENGTYTTIHNHDILHNSTRLVEKTK